MRSLQEQWVFWLHPYTLREENKSQERLLAGFQGQVTLKKSKMLTPHFWGGDLLSHAAGSHIPPPARTGAREAVLPIPAASGGDGGTLRPQGAGSEPRGTFEPN